MFTNMCCATCAAVFFVLFFLRLLLIRPLTSCSAHIYIADRLSLFCEPSGYRSVHSMISSYTMAGFVLLRLYLCVWVFALIVDSCVYLFVALECLTKVDLILMRSADLYKHTHALTDSLIFVVFFFWTTDIQQGKKDVEMTIITDVF